MRNVNQRTGRVLIMLMLTSAFATYASQRGPHVRSDKPAVGPAWSEPAASMAKMHAAMALVEPSGNSDVDFVKLMLPHHQAAIDMARTQLKYGNDPQMRRLAQEVIIDQQSEIELMHLWLRQRESSSRQEKPAPMVPASEER